MTAILILFIPSLITEADVTYNMLQHLYGGKARQLDKMRRTKPGRYEHPINFERRIINSTYRGLERYDNKMTENSLRFFLSNDLIFFSYLVWLVGG